MRKSKFIAVFGLIVSAGLLIVVLNQALSARPVFNSSGDADPVDDLPPALRADDSGATAEGTAALADGLNAFALDMYKALAAEGDGNLFYSPYSIGAALGMVREGAAGDTAAQMDRVLHLPADSAARRSAFAALHNALSPADAPYALAVANGIWAEQTYPLREDYIALLKGRFAAQADTADFIGQPEQSREEINHWVELRTAERIKGLFPEGSIKPETRLALVSAIYFKGAWADPFEPELTQEADFHAPSGMVRAMLMQRTGADAEYRYGETPALQALELPYEGDRLSLLVLLPRGKDVAVVEELLAPESIRQLRSQMTQRRVDVWLPRWKSETKYMLKDTLGAMGMPLAFEPAAADFSGMDGTRDLYIGVVVHQAFVEVNEEGTEAAAATGVTMDVRAAPMDPPQIPQFRADRPFVYAIVDNATGLLIFVGRVMEP